MTILETTQILPLRITDDGTIRVASTRVSLDSVIHHYKLGASAEQISQKFPALDLADVYASITYYLNNEAEVEEYLRRQEALSTDLQEKLESSPQYENTADLRSRLLARKSTKKC